MAYTTIDDPTAHFETKLWSGTGSTQSITNMNFQPDFIWWKERSSTSHHNLTDSVRGVSKQIYPNRNNAETSYSGSEISAFNSDGFSIGTSSDTNANGETYVSWNFKAGTSFSNDASSTGVGSLDSSGSKNTTAGFSIISFTGTESGTPSIAHGLSSTPEWIFSRPRDVSDNWMVFHGSFSAQDYMILNTTAAKASASSVWNSLPSSTVINMGDNAGVNDDGAMIMYAFHSVKGFSKFGSYTGNGDADGTFVYTGFRPAWLIIKQSSGAGNDWLIYDNKRDASNVANKLLVANANGTEATGQSFNYIDLLSNGFKLRGSDARNNGSGGTMIYMAFAESPFVNSNGVPNNAR